MSAPGRPSSRWLAVVGPTGSGKSELAVQLAERLGGEVVSTDSMQVYRGFDIGTAKPAAALRARAPHHLIDVTEPDQPYSAGRYVADATSVIARLEAQGRVPVLCGGTGLYFRALLFGLAEIPDIPAAVRDRVVELVARRGSEACHQELARHDPRAAERLHPHDSARIMRALEVVLATGETIETFRRRRPFQREAAHVFSVGYRWERAELYRAIDGRVARMLEQGWVAEVRGLLASGVGPALKPMRSIGYREICALLAGERAEPGLAQDIAQRTRHYAKRQNTWFNRHPDIYWSAPGHAGPILQQARNFLKTGSREPND